VEDGASRLDDRMFDGVAIRNVTPHSPAALAGLRGGHVAHCLKPFYIVRSDLIIATDAYAYATWLISNKRCAIWCQARS